MSVRAASVVARMPLAGYGNDASLPGWRSL